MNKLSLSIEKREVIKSSINKKFYEIFKDNAISESFKTNLKDDRTIVTEIDLYVSNLVKEILGQDSNLKHCNFFSEEDHGELKFPAIILDPIDGTKELIKGMPECTLSLALMSSSGDYDFGWIYNPFTGFEIHSDNAFVPPIQYRQRTPLGFVSQSEWSRGLYLKDEKDPEITLSPKGGMANKLFLLAVGACDFVITKRPKSIWDLAAGTILLRERGIKFYMGRNEVPQLDAPLYGDAPLIWVRDELKETIFSKFL